MLATLSNARHFATKYGFEEQENNKDPRRSGFIGKIRNMRLDFFKSSSSLRVWRRGYNQRVIKSISLLELEDCFRFPESIHLNRSPKPVKSEVSSDIGSTVTVNVPKVEPADWSTFKVDKEGFIEVYTDGACYDNGKENSIAGVGVWWGHGHKWNVSQPIVMGKTTNNLAEILAASISIKLASTNGISKLLIKTDSQYVIDCVTSWMPNWKKNGWMTTAKQPVKNKQYLEDLDMAINLTKIQVKWAHVKSHSGIEGNEEADKLAVKGALWLLDCEDTVDGSCTKPGEPKHGSAYEGSPIKTVQTPRPAMSTQSSLDSIRSYYTKETTPTKAVEGVKEDRESSLSKAQVDSLNQMTDSYGERFERAKWVENFIKQNHDAALKQKAASQQAAVASQPAPVASSPAPVAPSPSKPSTVEIPPMPPWPCAPKTNDPAEHEKYKKDYDAYSYWYNTYGTLYAAQQKALQQASGKPTPTPEATRSKPEPQPTHPGYSTKTQAVNTNPRDGGTLSDPNSVPPGTDPVAWRKYCKDTEEYWAKQAGHSPGSQAASMGGAEAAGSDVGRKAVQEKISKMMKPEAGQATAGYNYSTQYKGQPEKYEQKSAAIPGLSHLEDESGERGYAGSFSGQRRETGSGGYGKESGYGGNVKQGGGYGGAENSYGGGSKQSGSYGGKRDYGGNSKQSAGYGGDNYYEKRSSGFDRNSEFKDEGSYGERGYQGFGNRSNASQGKGSYGEQSRQFQGEDDYFRGGQREQDYDRYGQGGGSRGQQSGGGSGGYGGARGSYQGAGGNNYGGNKSGYDREEDWSYKGWGSYGGGDRY